MDNSLVSFFLTHGVYTMGLTVGACLEHGHGHKTPVRIHQNKPFKQEIRIFLRNIPITLHPNQRSGSPPRPEFHPGLRYSGERWLAAFNGLLQAAR